MTRRILLSGFAVIMLGLVVGAWQVAYTRGKEEGQSGLAGSRAAFMQERPPAGGVVMKIGGLGGSSDIVAADMVGGTIEKVEGQTVTVKTPAGSVKVGLGAQTRVRRLQPAEIDSLKPGDNVMVFGQKQGESEVTAESIDIQG